MQMISKSKLSKILKELAMVKNIELNDKEHKLLKTKELQTKCKKSEKK